MTQLLNDSTLKSVLDKLEGFLEKNHWQGWDPYDGLNSNFLDAITCNNKWLRIAVTQFMKRSPLNLRPLFGIPKSHNPKAMGLLASAYIVRYKTSGEKAYLNKAREILDWLVAHSTGYSGYAWGYNFDWQSAVFYVPRGTATVVNTSFIAQAFLDAYEVFKEKIYLDVAQSTCDFVLKDLNRTYVQSGFSSSKSVVCFSYTPLDKTCVHNATALAAELLARVNSIREQEELSKQSRKALEFVLRYQNKDGSWHYGLSPGQNYIDSFHTGFLLVSIYNIMQSLQATHDPTFRRKLVDGYNYYKRTFFDQDGMPHYFNNRIYPLDLHCSAQGVLTFLRFSDIDNDAATMAQKIARWAIDNMWDDRKGYFYFQKTKLLLNRIPYFRWPNVWMYYALAMLRDRGRGGKGEEPGAKRVRRIA